ncbi:hypothetical protein Tco_0810924 [Tanacetum coccineum]
MPQPSFNMNYMKQSMPNLKDISDPTTAINMGLILMITQPGQIAGNWNGYNAFQNVRNQNVNQTGNGNVVAARVAVNGNGNNGDIDEIKKVNANCLLMENL